MINIEKAKMKNAKMKNRKKKSSFYNKMSQASPAPLVKNTRIPQRFTIAVV